MTLDELFEVKRLCKTVWSVKDGKTEKKFVPIDKMPLSLKPLTKFTLVKKDGEPKDNG